MSFIQRLKNIWAWGEIKPRKENQSKEKDSDLSIANFFRAENPRPMATIIKLNPKDDIDEALAQVNEKKNG